MKKWIYNLGAPSNYALHSKLQRVSEPYAPFFLLEYLDNIVYARVYSLALSILGFTCS
jgi:hypothetical protein